MIATRAYPIGDAYGPKLGNQSILRLANGATDLLGFERGGIGTGNSVPDYSNLISGALEAITLTLDGLHDF